LEKGRESSEREKKEIGLVKKGLGAGEEEKRK
jgi:hypothetical protein